MCKYQIHLLKIPEKTRIHRPFQTNNNSPNPPLIPAFKNVKTEYYGSPDRPNPKLVQIGGEK